VGRADLRKSAAFLTLSVLVFAGSYRVSGASTGSIPAGEYSYEEAVALGLPVPPTPAQLGLPACEPAPQWPGLTAAEIDEVPNDAPVCAADPTDVVVSIGRPIPTGFGYHHNGAETELRFEGGRISTEVSNPAVDHRDVGADEFVAARVMGKIPDANPCHARYKWLEVGWAEVSWKSNDRRVYTFKTGACAWFFHPNYQPTDGRYYVFRVRGCSTDTCAEVYWAGEWVVLDSAAFGCRGSSGNDLCFIEEYLEIYSEDASPHPGLNAGLDGAGVNFRNTQLRTGVETWEDWTVAQVSTERQVAPYNVCWEARYSNWRSGRSVDCSDPLLPGDDDDLPT
jgi:hypothetical protein